MCVGFLFNLIIYIIFVEKKSNVCSLPFKSIIQSYVVKDRKKIFYLMMHSTHFIYSYMASDIW